MRKKVQPYTKVPMMAFRKFVEKPYRLTDAFTDYSADFNNNDLKSHTYYSSKWDCPKSTVRNWRKKFDEALKTFNVGWDDMPNNTVNGIVKPPDMGPENNDEGTVDRQQNGTHKNNPKRNTSLEINPRDKKIGFEDKSSSALNPSKPPASKVKLSLPKKVSDYRDKLLASGQRGSLGSYSVETKIEEVFLNDKGRLYTKRRTDKQILSTTINEIWTQIYERQREKEASQDILNLVQFSKKF